MYIKDLQTGVVRKYGTSQHDALRISDDGKELIYENLQNGDGSHGDYRFCDEDGLIPEQDAELMRCGGEMYFNIGGFDAIPRQAIDDAIAEIESLKGDGFPNSYYVGIIKKHIAEVKE